MKKAIVVILAILPIFLILTISFAGRIVADFVYIKVENVHFVDDKDEIIDNTTVRVGVEGNNKLQLKAMVLPEQANNKNVTYRASGVDADDPIFSVDENGLITGLKYGTATVIVETEEAGKKAYLNIKVTDDDVSGITLNVTEKTLVLGERFELKATIKPATVLDIYKNVTWSSSDPEKVSVDVNGNILARAATVDKPVKITVTTVQGGYTAVCLVTVEDAKLPLMFKTEEFYVLSANAPDNKINLMDYIEFDSQTISAEFIAFKIIVGETNGNGKIEGRTLEFLKTYGQIIIQVYDTRDASLFNTAGFWLIG